MSCGTARSSSASVILRTSFAFAVFEEILAITNTDVDEAIHAVKDNADAIFTWDYERSRPPLVKLYEKAKHSMWNGETDLPWETVVDPDAALAPFLAAANPTLMQMGSWQELANPRDLTKIFQTPEYAAWRSLRESEDARYLVMAMPRFLARLPYGAKTNPVEGFDFEEDTAGAQHDKYSWANAAYAMATNITRSFKTWGWCSRIRGVESGGAVEGLPTHTFPSDDGGVDMKCPTEIAISDRREAELAKNGFMPLVHKKNSDFAAFIGAQSLQKPFEYDDPDATANANLAARLPYLFATCRFAHYLKCIVRDKVGSFASREAMTNYLNNWIGQYVDGDPLNSTEEFKARKPLAAAEVQVEEVEGAPGYYSSKFFLKPHYQLEGLTVSLRLVSKLPSEKSA